MTTRTDATLTASNLPEFLKYEDVAGLIDVSISSLYKWVADGTFLPPLQIGPNVRRWRRETLLAWLEKRQTA